MGQPHPTPRPPEACSFGEFTLDLTRGALMCGATEIKLRPKSFELLKYLVLRAGRLVTKGELLQALWPDTTVGDDAVPHCLMEVRKALGTAGPELVKTVPGRGYIFEPGIGVGPPPKTGRKPLRAIAFSNRLRLLYLAAFLVVAGAVGSVAWGGIKIRSARQALPRVEALANAGRYLESYDQAVAALKYLPNEIRLTQLMPSISDDLSVSSTPSGATVYLKSLVPEQTMAQKRMAGKTPISHLRIARGEYVLSVEMPGYAPFERTVSSALRRGESPKYFSDGYEIHADCRLVKAAEAPERMVFVPGGDYQLQGWDIPYDGSVRLEDYFIDKFEVSNRQFKEFIDSGGYLDKRFWKQPIVRNGNLVSLEEGLAGFKDRTGLPGPRTWSGGTFPAAKGDHPVTDITWYEAAAYATFRNKRLPTIFEWEKAARGGLGRYYRGLIAPWGAFQGDTTLSRAIFESSGTAPVDSLESGMSPYGAYHMAGNVKEWCLNGYQDGFVTAGGSWNDPAYRFGAYGAIPPLLASDTIGFRCARSAAGNSDQGAMRFNEPLKAPSYKPTSESYFHTLMRAYRYDRTPLEAVVSAEKDFPDWHQIDITYNGANKERVTAYLLLPKNRTPPFQVIHFIPGTAFRGEPLLKSFAFRMTPHVRAGRAVFLVSLKGFYERPWPPGHREPDVSSVEYRDQVVQWANDMRRGIDYLQTRNDIDVHRIAFWNVSDGKGPLFAAVEDRYRAVILMSGGMNEGGPNYIAEADPLNFAGHIRPPKLQFCGRFDEGARFRLGTEPLYKLLSEPKSQTIYDGGHLPPPDLSVKVVNAWLDETMGSIGSSAVKIAGHGK